MSLFDAASRVLALNRTQGVTEEEYEAALQELDAALVAAADTLAAAQTREQEQENARRLWQRSSENWEKAAVGHNQRAEAAEAQATALATELGIERGHTASWRDRAESLAKTRDRISAERTALRAALQRERIDHMDRRHHGAFDNRCARCLRLTAALRSAPAPAAQATLTIAETRTLLHDQSAEQQRQRDAALKRDWPDAQADRTEDAEDANRVGLEQMKRADAAERQLAEMGVQMEAIEAIVNGREPSDFLLSFPLVRAADDLRQQLAEQAQELARLRSAILALAPHASMWEALTNEQIVRTRLVSVDAYNQSRDEANALREALTDIVKLNTRREDANIAQATTMAAVAFIDAVKIAKAALSAQPAAQAETKIAGEGRPALTPTPKNERDPIGSPAISIAQAETPAVKDDLCEECAAPTAGPKGHEGKCIPMKEKS